MTAASARFINLSSTKVQFMKSKTFPSLVIGLCSTCLLAIQAPGEDKAHGPSPGLDRFTQLAGEWVGKGTHGDMSHDARVDYKVTSGGSTVVETIDPGGQHEMITVIHADGESLLLTHYCMIGNQPQMKAKPKAGENKVAFEFVKATNLKSDKDMHMHSVTFTFVDQDTLKTEWTNYDNGKESGKSVFELKRKKPAANAK
jgi:hypothetical protein